MNNTSVSQKHFDRTCIFYLLRACALMLIGCSFVVAPPFSRAAELKQDTLAHWNAYIDASRPQMGSETTFLWVDQDPDRLRRVHEGEVLVVPVGRENPKPVSSGLIHDWRGAAFLPGTKMEDVLAAVRDYGSYKEYYKPTVVDSRLLSRSGTCEKYSMRVVNKEVVAQTALDIEYATCYFKVDEHRWYSTTQTTRVQEFRHYGQANEEDFHRTTVVALSGACTASQGMNSGTAALMSRWKR